MDILQGYVNDMLAVERQLHQALRRHKEHEPLRKFAAAKQLVARIEDTIDRHLVDLEACLRRLGGDDSALKKAVGTFLGFAAGIYDKVRTEDNVSRILRDDHTALNFACVCYQMLHTTALAMKDSQTADLALRNLTDFTALVRDLSDTLPGVLLEELAQQRKIAPDPGIAAEAVRHTREAWMHDPTGAQPPPM
jgi:ferritin-like metal-binding protein YciE